jgi:DnaK suppressor protein
MTDTELNRFRNVLMARRAELEQMIRNRHRIAIQASPELEEQIQQATERELALDTLERESRQLREARAALDRIADRTFGVCVDCQDSPYCLGRQPASRVNRLRMKDGNCPWVPRLNC